MPVSSARPFSQPTFQGSHQPSQTLRRTCEPTAAPLMTTFRVSREPPCDSTLRCYAATRAVSARPFNHGFLPNGGRPEERLRILELRTRLGSGEFCFRRARKLLLAWDVHSGSSRTGIWTDNEGAVVTWAQLVPGLWVLNPCRVLPTRSDWRCVSVGYATTRGHLIAGFERMEVRWHAHDDSVTFDIHSESRGAGLVGRTIFPLLAPAQMRFFSEQLRCMRAQFYSA
jgi:uncharacterized protein (UPF0548 family)